MANVVFTEERENQLMSKIRWKIVPYVMLLYIVAMLDRVNIGFAALQMNKDLGISASMFGMLAGVFFITYFFFEVPSNVIMHKVGARKWIARILVSWGLVTVFLAFAQNVTHVAILRGLLGAAEAGFYPCIVLYFTFWFPTKHFAKTMSLFMCGMALANIIVGPISSWIMENVTWMGLAGWRWMFILEGLPAVILGFVTLFVLVDRPDQAKFLTAEEKQWLLAELEREHVAKQLKVKVASKWEVFKNSRVWHLAFCYLCYVLALYGLGMWMPQILKNLAKAMSLSNIGLISTIPYMCAIIAMVYVARRSDALQERRYHTALPIGIAFFGLIGLTMTDNLITSMLLLCVSQAAIYSFVGTFWSLPNLYLSEATAAVGIAIINSVGNLGGFFGPYMVGFLKDATGSTNAGMYFLATFAILGTISVLAIPKKEAAAESLRQPGIKA
ncbi:MULTISPECIES: MFS transporter [Sporomusa]|uniref:MFS transporter n=1 Tax=Sporomusa TaxID=2375 RepID=UPI002030D4FA|nr:MFS transporter [Sporomusa sphaeroides]MCM0760650.1 MFS transporter [Sporomusa sphaeroides DSM 2875]